MNQVTQILGIGLIVLALLDIFWIVLYPRSGLGWVSVPLSRTVWQLFRTITTLPSGRWKRYRSFLRKHLLSYCGPVLLVTVVLVWILLLVTGFALIIWSALGTGIQASQGATSTNFATAFYYSGCVFTTVGAPDLLPQTETYRLLALIESGLGFATFTLTITYLLAIYTALTQRNVLALTLHHQTAGSASAAELLARLGAGGDFNNARQDIAELATSLLILLESHHSYPILHYFRFQSVYYALARITLLAMDTATLIRSALPEQHYRSLIHSTAVTTLGDGGQHLLIELADSFLPTHHPHRRKRSEAELRSWYYQAVERLKLEGIVTVADLEAGADRYVALRHRWEPYVMTIADYMAYEWRDIAPAEANPLLPELLPCKPV